VIVRECAQEGQETEGVGDAKVAADCVRVDVPDARDVTNGDDHAVPKLHKSEHLHQNIRKRVRTTRLSDIPICSTIISPNMNMIRSRVGADLINIQVDVKRAPNLAATNSRTLMFTGTKRRK
jgi:hypothetical protein